MQCIRGIISPLLALPLMGVGTATASAVEAAGVQIHGFASQGYLYSHGDPIFSDNSDEGGTFDFNEVGVNFTATPVSRLRVGAQLFASALGKYGKDKLELDWGYGEYQVPTGSDDCELTVQAGRIKTNQAFYNDYRDLDMTRTQVFLPMSVYSQQYRDLAIAINGVGFTATAHAGAAGTFILYGAIGGQNVSADSALGDSFSKSLGGAPISDISIRHQAGTSLTWETPVEGLRAKASLLNISRLTVSAPGTTITLPEYYSGVGGIEYQHGSLTLVTEATTSYSRIETEFGGAGITSYTRQRGAYVTAAWRFDEHWEALVGGLWNQDLEQEKTTGDPDASFTRGVNVALRCDITEHWLVKAEFQRNRGTMLLVNTGTSALPPGETYDKCWNLLALKTTFDF